jgi:hypothetical protein
MNKFGVIIVFAVVIGFCCCIAHGSTLTFDEVPSGTCIEGSLFYNENYRVWFASPFEASDHSGSSWGLPHSGTNVLAWKTSASTSSYGLIAFGFILPSGAYMDEVRSISAFYSTKPNVMVRVTAYHWIPPSGKTEIASVIIGGQGESWNNEYVEIGSSEGFFNELVFEGVNSSDELYGFCLDDLTITYVPEPSSLLALCAGLVSAGVMVRRRR